MALQSVAKKADTIVPLAVVVNNLGRGTGGVSLCKVSLTFYANKNKIFYKDVYRG